jgi:hypothetical protein
MSALRQSRLVTETQARRIEAAVDRAVCENIRMGRLERTQSIVDGIIGDYLVSAIAIRLTPTCPETQAELAEHRRACQRAYNYRPQPTAAYPPGAFSQVECTISQVLDDVLTPPKTYFPETAEPAPFLNELVRRRIT